MEGILLDAQKLKNKLVAWTLTAPAEHENDILLYTSRNTDLPETSSARLSPATGSVACLTTWNRYRGARLVVNCMLENINRRLLFAEPTTRIMGSRIQIDKARFAQQALVDEICGSVPFILDDTESQASARTAAMLSWPLTIAAVVPGISDQQRQWIRKKLKLISEITSCATFGKLAELDLHKRPGPLVVTQPSVVSP